MLISFIALDLLVEFSLATNDCAEFGPVGKLTTCVAERYFLIHQIVALSGPSVLTD
jgi:hypothetical protein